MLAQPSSPPPLSVGFAEQLTLAPFKRSAPVNVLGAANALGISVYSKKLPANVSGILRRDASLGGDSGFVILVQEHPVNRQRFTIAHEIGHFVLHRQSAESGIQDDEFYRALPGPLEREANQFAAELLMPWPLIKSLQDKGVTGLSELAQALQVSKQALAIRLGIPYDQDWS